MMKLFPLLLAVLLMGCSPNNYPILQMESETEPVYQSKQDLGEPLTVAIASITSAKESIIFYEDLIYYLQEALGQPIEVVQRKTYAEVNELLAAGTIDFAFICTYSYVSLRENHDIQILAAPRMPGGLMKYQSFIIVNADSDITTLEELKNKTFAFTDPISSSGRLYALYQVRTELGHGEEFFGNTVFTYGHDNSIRSVAKNLVDGAAVHSMVYENLIRSSPELMREKEVLQLIALGHTNQQIADKLVISVKTVESHKARIKTKLNVTKRSELVRYAIENGLLNPS